MASTSILVVEDDLTLNVMLKTWLSKKKFDVYSAINIKEAHRRIKKQRVDIVLSDIRLPDGDGLSFLKYVHNLHKTIPVILMTSYAEISAAVAAIKSGAYDYIAKPLNQEDLLKKIQAAIAEKSAAPQNETPIAVEPAKDNIEKPDMPANDDADYVQGQSDVYQQVYKYVDLVAPTNMSVLILGESGVGKERIARLIHEKSNRSDAPFVAVDCGILSKELAASEFFGHIKGSFTGAISNKKGFFLTADTGTIFLDEVGNLSPDVQIQLLRVLQERRIRAVGSEKDIPVDVRVIAATNEKIDINVPNPSFRLDLYHRLSEFILKVPSLRECQEDIPLFLDFFLDKSNKELHKNIKGFTPEALKILANYRWSGNFREMKNVVNIITLVTNNPYITESELPENILSASKLPA